VADLATGAEDRVAQSESQARLLGSNPESPHIAVALPPQEGEAETRRHMLTALARGTSGRILHGVVGGWGLLLIPIEGQKAEDVVQKVRRAAKFRARSQAGVLGVGTVAPRLGAVRSSCQQALVAAEVGIAQEDPTTVVYFDDVLLEAALLADHRVAERLATVVLRSLPDQPTLLATLRTYLLNDLSQTRTAAELVVHPNTVAYRLDRIRQITGHDVRQLAHAMTLMVAVRAFDLLGGRT
jgi:DNA-binding PucR family transcriptional regulator